MWGNLLCGGMCVGYALFGGVLVVVDYDEFADFGAAVFGCALVGAEVAVEAGSELVASFVLQIPNQWELAGGVGPHEVASGIGHLHGHGWSLVGFAFNVEGGFVDSRHFFGVECHLACRAHEEVDGVCCLVAGSIVHGVGEAVLTCSDASEWEGDIHSLAVFAQRGVTLHFTVSFLAAIELQRHGVAESYRHVADRHIVGHGDVER